MYLSLPTNRILIAVSNIYLVLSLGIIHVISADKPVAKLVHSDTDTHTWSDCGEPTEDNIVIKKRSVPGQYEDYEELLFHPSSNMEDSFGQRLESRVDSGRGRHRETVRPRGQRQRHGSRRQGQGGPYRHHHYRRQEDQSLYRQRQRQETSPYSTYYENRYQEPNKRIQKQPPAPARVVRPPVIGLSGFDYYDDTYNGVLDPVSPPNKPNILNSIFSLIKPKTPKRPAAVEIEQSRPSWQFVTNENEFDVGEKALTVNATGGEQFIPNLLDYEDGNIDYLDQDTEPEYPQPYSFKDVIYSIKNNESRILTLKKFLSAASAMTDRAGTDPVTMLWQMPLTILSFLGIFYAISASAVLAYKYVLLTTGSSNGQAVDILPVIVLFVVPIVLVTVFLIARGAFDGQINFGQLARGDLKNGFSQDFESVDFMYDLGVGATAVLGLGWMVSITL